MTRTICVTTGSRAEYGLLRWVLEGIRSSSVLRLQLIVTGMHLAPEFGHTYREIEADGFAIDRKIEVLMGSDTPVSLAKSMGLGMIGFGEALAQFSPDLLLVLGDRFEILPAVAAALVARIPVAHLHGGEVTEGAFDDAIRHSITKMSHLHFVAAEEYRRRVIQLGEDPERVFVVGGLGIDSTTKLSPLDREQLEVLLDFELGPKNLLVSFHPATLEDSTPADQMIELLAALDSLEDTHLIFTMPNADSGGRVIAQMIGDYVASRATARAYASLGQLLYLSCIRHVDGVVGNSSSGLIEVPSLKKGTVNIGSRQRGRLRASSVIDCQAERTAITEALKKLYSVGFRESLANVTNPYGNGGASERVVAILETVPVDSLINKTFRDLR